MKVYKLNSLTTFFFFVLITCLVVFLPIVLIQLLWNTIIGKVYTDTTIDFWQSFLLWLIVLLTLNILGVFKFEFAIEKQGDANSDLLKKKIKEQEIEGKEEKETKKE